MRGARLLPLRFPRLVALAAGLLLSKTVSRAAEPAQPSAPAATSADTTASPPTQSSAPAATRPDTTAPPPTQPPAAAPTRADTTTSPALQPAAPVSPRPDTTAHLPTRRAPPASRRPGPAAAPPSQPAPPRGQAPAATSPSPQPAGGADVPLTTHLDQRELFEAMLRRVRDADSVVVTRVAPAPKPVPRPPAAASAADSIHVAQVASGVTSSPDSLRPALEKQGPESWSESRPGHDWATRLAEALGAGIFYPDLKCRAAPPPEKGTEPVLVLVHAYRGDRQLFAEVRMADRCVNLRDRFLGDGSIEFPDEAQPMLDLVGEALPQDPVVQRAILPSAKREKGPPPAATQEIAVAPPTDEELPKFGEYVSVEELPEAVSPVQPAYPDSARKAGVEGSVVIQALVGKDGLVKDTHVVTSIPALDTAAVAAVRQYRFKPAMNHRNPVAVWVAVPVKFSLAQSPPGSK